MVYVPTLPDTLFFNSVDIRDLPGISVDSIDLFAPGTRRGDNDTIPRRRGQVLAPKVYDAYAFSAHITVLEEDEDGFVPSTEQGRRALMIANLRGAAEPLAGTDGLGPLKRRLSDSATSYVEHTAAGEFVSGLSLVLLNFYTGQTELQFVNGDGCWFSADAPTVPIVP